MVPPTTAPRQLAAELVQRAYLKNRSADLLVLLSELQVGGRLVGCWLVIERQSRSQSD